MREIIMLILIAIALSMDTFSLSLGLGTYNLSSKRMILFSSIVGLMHFLMPLIGNIIGSKIISLFAINSNFLLGIILIYLSLVMFIDILKKEEKRNNLNILNMFIFAFGVSIDSFSTGLGLEAITSNILPAVLIFSLCSFSFTILGLLIGKYARKLLGTYASIFGAILLLVIGTIYLCQ
jgi:putative Mn2+ efflux pump MntP